MFSMAMWMAALVTPLQIFAGDLHGLNTLEHQPAKIAAMEGHYETHDGAPLILFGIPDDKAEETHYAIEIPKLGSLILPRARWRDQGPEGIPARRAAAGADPVLHLPHHGRPRLPDARRSASGRSGRAGARRSTSNRWLHRAALVMGPSGFVAVLAGWYTTEVGRQPYTVYGLLRTVRQPLQRRCRRRSAPR